MTIRCINDRTCIMGLQYLYLETENQGPVHFSRDSLQVLKNDCVT